MRRLLVLLFLPVFAGCSCAELDQAELLTGAPPAAAVDAREPAGGHIYDPDDRQTCQSPYEPHIEIPCGDIINACVLDDSGGRSAILLPDAYRCTPESPAVRDLCQLVPVDQLPFYGLTPADC